MEHKIVHIIQRPAEFQYQVPDPNIDPVIIRISVDDYDCITGMIKYDYERNGWCQKDGYGNIVKLSEGLFTEGSIDWMYRKDFIHSMALYKRNLIIDEI